MQTRTIHRKDKTPTFVPGFDAYIPTPPFPHAHLVSQHFPFRMQSDCLRRPKLARYHPPAAWMTSLAGRARPHFPKSPVPLTSPEIHVSVAVRAASSRHPRLVQHGYTHASHRSRTGDKHSPPGSKPLHRSRIKPKDP